MSKCNYIVFEGIDGAGKSSLIELLVQELQDRGYKVLSIREPSHYIKEDNKILATIKFANDRYTQLHSISFNEYDYIISDRSFYSNLAYQGVTDDLRKWIWDVNKYVPQPSLVFLVDISGNVSCKRECGFISPELSEYLDECRKRYYNLCIPGMVVLDGLKPLVVSLDEVLRVLGVIEEE